MSEGLRQIAADCFSPRSCLWDFQELPEDSEVTMELRLVYRGALPSASNSNPKPKAQHGIRKQLHPQLKQYWTVHPHLKHFFTPGPG